MLGVDRFSHYLTGTSLNLFVNAREIFANDAEADQLTDLITAVLEAKGRFLYRAHPYAGDNGYTNKTAFTIAASNRLRRDSTPKSSTNHSDAKLIANPSSFNVVNLVP